MTPSDPFQRQDSCFNTLEGWTWVGCYGGYYLTCDLLTDAGFEHGFFTRRWNGRGPDVLAGVISAGATVHRPQQIHSNLVLDAASARCEPWPSADGLVSDEGGQSLWVCGADCTPVLIADPGTGHAAACHAGWRGVAGRILKEAILRLERRGASRESLIAALGPAASGARYQVGEEVVTAIESSLREGMGNSLKPRELLMQAGALLPDGEPGRHRLDIRCAAALQLQQEGLSAERIGHCPLCTIGEPELFHSWRRDQRKAVQWSGIIGQAEEPDTASTS